MGNPRIVLLAALGFIMMLMWQEWQKDYGPKPVQTATSQAETVKSIPSTGHEQEQVTTEELPSLSAGSSLNEMPVADQQTNKPEQPIITTNQIIEVLTDKLQVWINTRGGEISGVSLRAYPVELDKQDEPYVLLTKQKDKVYIAQTGLLSSQGAPNHLTDF